MEFSQNVAKKMLSCQNLDTSQTSTQERPRMTLATKTTLTMLKRGEMLVVTHVAMSGCLHLPNSTEHQPSERLVFIDGGNTLEG